MDILNSLCHVCQIPATKKCGGCKAVVYCDVAHQRQNWPAHKATCLQVRERMSQCEDRAGWAKNLSPDKAAEWFVDCFRMCMDDDQTWTAAGKYGFYFTDDQEKLQEFLIFCKLAVQNNVAPSTLSWAMVLDKALDLIGYAFEKSDAQEKYGSENVFAAMTGGRSLRFTAEAIYGTSTMSPAVSAKYTALKKQATHRGVFANAGFFNDIGGCEAWKAFRSKFHPPQTEPFGM